MIKNYRKDIDSLRGISVLFVIFFHLKLPQFDGGYLGVDIFFVISGFLITKIILNETDQKNFTIRNFYLRRIRRILPLVLLVTFISTIVGYLFFFPKEFEDFSKSILFINLFVSNFWYGSKGDYFGPIIDEDPLIHFWSLSVEEQYYLFYPLIFLFFIKKKNIKSFFTFIVFIMIFSFSLAQFGGNLKFNYPFIESEFNFFSIPQFAFYSSVTRAWEILIGCAAAIYIHKKKREIIYQKHIVNFSFVLLLFSLLLLKDDMPHPSFLTLIPIIFTTLILVYNENNFSENKILDSKILSSIGLISFSLYLWHQPVFVYAGLYNILEPNINYKFLLLIFVFVISYLSWKFVESPFRNKNKVKNNFLFSYIFLVFIGLISLIFIFNNQNDNYDPTVKKILDESTNYDKKYFDICTSYPKNYVKPDKACTIGDQNQKEVEFAIIGDSHAAALAYAFNKEFIKKNKKSYLFTYNGCATSFNLYNYTDNRYKCRTYYNELKNFIENNKEIKNIILHSRWGFYISGERFNNQEGRKEVGKDSVFLRNEKDLLLNKDDRKLLVAKEIRNFINFFSGDRKVFIISSIPEVGFDVPKTVARSIKFEKSHFLNNFTTSYKAYSERQKIINDVFYELASENKINFFDSSKIFCDTKKGRCRYTINNIPLYFDDDHLNNIGSTILVNKFFKK